MEVLHYVFLTPTDSPNWHPLGVFHFVSEIDLRRDDLRRADNPWLWFWKLFLEN